MDAGGSNEQADKTLPAEGIAAEQKSGAGQEGKDDGEKGDGVGADAEADEERRERFRPLRFAAFQGTAFRHDYGEFTRAGRAKAPRPASRGEGGA